MTNLFSLKNNIANSLKDSNKKKSHSKFVSSEGLLENSDFKLFLELYLNNETEFFERIDGYDGFISTQQIESIDYENFAEHVFFDSAVEKVNYAFDKSINEFPYDSTLHEYNQYLKKLDGFTRFILKNKVKKNKNYLSLDTTKIVEIIDKKGYLLNDYTGEKTLDNFNPKGKSFSYDFWLYPRHDGNSNKSLCIFKKYDDDNGYIITNEFAQNSNLCKIKFYFLQDGTYFLSEYDALKTNEFQHIFFEMYNENINDVQQKNFRLFVDGKEINKNYLNPLTKGSVSSITLNFTNDTFSNSNIYLGGSNSNITFDNFVGLDNIDFNSGGYDGIIDEFKIFIGKKRSYSDIIKFMNENTHASDSLALYYKFNEPDGVYSNNFLILDYSGNKLHGSIKEIDINKNITSVLQNFSRNSVLPDVSIPLKYELEEKNPILFSSFSQDNKDYLIKSAIEYDLINPNSFWKLFPKHIFVEGSDYDNVDLTYVSNKTSSSKDILGTEKSVNQEIIKLISIWARFFDQIKMYIDSFTELLNFSYDTINNSKKIDGMILPLALNQAGFKFRELQAFPILEKLENKNLTHEEILSVLSVRQIQNILWKRFLLNSKDYIMSKGTKKSIKSVFNSFGLEANKYISIKEINGQNRFNINNQYIQTRQRIKFIDFNKHDQIFEETSYINNTSQNRFSFETDFLSKEDLDFEGNWTVEQYFRFDANKFKMFENNQSLLRIDYRLFNSNDIKPFINVVFSRLNNENNFGNLTFFIKHADNSVDSINLENINLLNGYLYHIAIRKKYNEKRRLYEYFLNIGPSGELSYANNKKLLISTSKQRKDTQFVQNQYRISVGNFKYQETIDDTRLNDLYYNTDFQGMLTQFRVYKEFIKDEILDVKIKDIKYISSILDNKTDGVNYDLSLDALLVNIDLTDKTEIEYNLSNSKLLLFNYVVKETKINCYLHIGNLLQNNNTILGNSTFTYEDHTAIQQNPEIDVIQDSNKVYINSFEDEHYKQQYKNDNITHSSQHHPDYLYYDDQRLYVDFSTVNFLNKDISKLISVNDFFTKNLSKTSCLYEYDYKDLKFARDVYFKRIKSNEDINFDMLYQVYKYFDNILEDLLYDAIPSRVNYLGFNFVYESHVLERNKYQYKFGNSRLPISSETGLEFQDYRGESNTIKYRTDDLSGFFESSIIKKKDF